MTLLRQRPEVINLLRRRRLHLRSLLALVVVRVVVGAPLLHLRQARVPLALVLPILLALRKSMNVPLIGNTIKWRRDGVPTDIETFILRGKAPESAGSLEYSAGATFFTSIGQMCSWH